MCSFGFVCGVGSSLILPARSAGRMSTAYVKFFSSIFPSPQCWGDDCYVWAVKTSFSQCWDDEVIAGRYVPRTVDCPDECRVWLVPASCPSPQCGRISTAYVQFSMSFSPAHSAGQMIARMCRSNQFFSQCWNESSVFVVQPQLFRSVCVVQPKNFRARSAGK